MKAFRSQFTSAGFGVSTQTQTTTTKTISSTVKRSKKWQKFAVLANVVRVRGRFAKCATFLDPSATLELDIEGNLKLSLHLLFASAGLELPSRESVCT